MAGADGGNTSSADAKLASCTVKTIFSNKYSYAALCSNGTVVAWGKGTGVLPLFACLIDWTGWLIVWLG